MKKLTGLVVIIAALVLGSYYGMGYLTEKKLKESLNVVSQSYGVSADVASYKRGWFTSEAVLNWGLHVPEHTVMVDGQSKTITASDFKMQMPITIHHGPIIFADKRIKFGLGYAKTELPLPEQYNEQFNTLFTAESTKPKLDMNLFVSYLNNTSMDLAVPAFKLIAKEGGAQLDWMGLTSSTDVSSNLDKIDGAITLDGVNFTKDDVKTTVGSVTSEYNLHKNEKDMYLGDASLSFPSLIVMDHDKKLLEISQFDTHSDASIENDLFSTHFKASVEKMVANEQNFGPGNFEIAIKNLDADVLARINMQVNQLQQGSDADRQKALLALLPELPKLFSKGPEFEITELSFVMPQGTVEGSMMISLPKADTGNPIELIQKIQGKGKLRIPAEVVKGFVAEEIRQKMIAAPQGLQQAITQQMQQNSSQATPTAQATTSAAASTGATATVQAVVPVEATTPVAAPAQMTTPADPALIAQQASEAADKQLAAMVQSGLLSMQGTDYVVEMNLNQGQLTINGKPFNPAMMKY